MLLPFRTRGNPLLERLNLFRRKRLSLRRHPLGFIGCAHPVNERALVNMARYNRPQTGVEFGERGIRLVEPQPALASRWSVATKTSPSEQRLNIARKADR